MGADLFVAHSLRTGAGMRVARVSIRPPFDTSRDLRPFFGQPLIVTLLPAIQLNHCAIRQMDHPER